MKKKKINWKKVRKNFNKSWGKSQKWVETHVNPDLLSGNEDRIFAPQGFDFGDSYHPKRRTYHKKHSRSRHSGSSRGKTITIKIN